MVASTLARSVYADAVCQATRPRLAMNWRARSRCVGSVSFYRARALIASGKVDLKPLATETFAFADSGRAFERAAQGLPTDVKLQIRVTESAE